MLGSPRARLATERAVDLKTGINLMQEAVANNIPVRDELAGMVVRLPEAQH